MRLGRMPEREATRLRERVSRLESLAVLGEGLDEEMAAWSVKLGKARHARLVAAGLLPARAEMQRGKLKLFVDGYIAQRVDVKPRTLHLLKETGKALVEFFKAETALASITAGDADAFRLWLLGKGLGDNTVRRRCGRAKQFFRAACRQRLLRDNPFADLPSAVRGSPEKFYFVSRDEAAAVLKACPDVQWQVLFALSRFGALRCPSEHLELRWADVDWDNNRVRVRSPKTEHHEGKAERVMPLWPELRPYLEAARVEAEPGAEFVITRYRSTNANLRTQLERIIRKAKLTPWPKLFQNLRSTRETELASEGHPVHLVCAWVGNSVAVAAKHYLQITEADFERAQKRAQNGLEQSRMEPHRGRATHEKSPVLPGLVGSVESAVPPVGLEPTTL